jgi:ABC-type multidrug transport system fused ATPase/permease subunit
MTICAVVMGIGAFTQKASFGTLGNNVTLEVRKMLYSNIMQKNIGWFDDRENTPSVLTTVIASDTAVINGVSSESLGHSLKLSLLLQLVLSSGFSTAGKCQLCAFAFLLF